MMSRNNEPSTHRQRHHDRDDGEAMSVLGGKAEDICSSGAFQLLTLSNRRTKNLQQRCSSWLSQSSNSFVVPLAEQNL
jgi:hypothetical protein